MRPRLCCSENLVINRICFCVVNFWKFHCYKLKVPKDDLPLTLNTCYKGFFLANICFAFLIWQSQNIRIVFPSLRKLCLILHSNPFWHPAHGVCDWRQSNPRQNKITNILFNKLFQTFTLLGFFLPRWNICKQSEKQNNLFQKDRSASQEIIKRFKISFIHLQNAMLYLYILH